MGINEKNFSLKISPYMEETKAKDTIPRPAHSSKKDPASKAKTLTTLNRYAEITFEWTGGCKMTC